MRHGKESSSPLAGGAVGLLRSPRQPARVRPGVSIPTLRAPLVLVPGLLGYGEVRVFDRTLFSYFANLPAVLRAAGNTVHVARLHPVASVAYRAWQLRGFLESVVPGRAVHLLAHSMGGLDARYLISRLGMADRVLTLTTLGTPHRGTAFADWCVRRFGRLVRPMLAQFALPYHAVGELTRERCRLFNEHVPDAPGVRYFSVAGRHTASWLSPVWRLPHAIVARDEGPNDGLVSVASATYGESCSLWEGDHLSLINWHSPLALWRGLGAERTSEFAGLLGRLVPGDAKG
jgi:triacylglycerol lipase